MHRHSGSPTGEVHLSHSDGHLSLEIRDAGRGLDPERLDGASRELGVGILGMRERVNQLGGSLDILDGSPGTVVRTRIPAKPVQAASA